VHVYGQWLMATQLEELVGTLAARDQVLYLDLPIGAHRDGYDVAVEGDLFVRDASGGAPPDNFYAAGQNWGFPPVDPRAARRTGYSYLAACLDAQLRYARVLRVDHVMGWHRLWMIAPGADPKDGAYVHYAAEEQWAVACIACARHDATLVGENLGTVPAETDKTIRRHRALGMWLAQFELPDASDADVTAPSSGQLACLDTHDLPTFAAWWQNLADAPRAALISTLRDAGDLDDAVTPQNVLAATLSWLARSRAPIVLVQLEDLWLETEPQNTPGEPNDANFRRRAAHGLDELDALPQVRAVIARLETLRNRTRSAV
jgi:4-alpha-glucanotransferase